MPIPTSVRVIDHTSRVLAGITELASKRVMVGIPASDAARKEGEITNAALGYIHENGAPEVHIPARPWLVPGVKSTQQESVDGLRKAGELALAGRGADVVERQLHVVGLKAVNAVRAFLTAGVPPALADGTLEERAARGRKGAARELKRRAGGQAPGMADAKPLLDTGQMRNAVTYVLRSVSSATLSVLKVKR